MTARQKPYSAAIIGTGRIGHSLGKDPLREQPASHSRALSNNPRVTLAAATDTDGKILAGFKKDLPAVRIYPGTDELMRAEKPDIVVIAVDTEYHRDAALSVLPFRPRLVILEKPVAPDREAAREIARAAARHDVPVQVNHERRFALDYLLVRDLLSSGHIGELTAARAHLWSGAPVWDKKAQKTGACSLLHDGTHLVDTLRFLLGKEFKNPVIDFVKKNKEGKIIRLQVHEVIGRELFVALEFAGDKKVFDFEIDLEGASGRMLIGNGFLKVYSRAPSPFYSTFFSLRRDRSVRGLKKTGYFSNMLANCVDFLDEKAALVSPLSEGIKTLDALYKIIDQLS